MDTESDGPQIRDMDMLASGNVDQEGYKSPRPLLALADEIVGTTTEDQSQKTKEEQTGEKEGESKTWPQGVFSNIPALNRFKRGLTASVVALENEDAVRNTTQHVESVYDDQETASKLLNIDIRRNRENNPGEEPEKLVRSAESVLPSRPFYRKMRRLLHDVNNKMDDILVAATGSTAEAKPNILYLQRIQPPNAKSNGINMLPHREFAKNPDMNVVEVLPLQPSKIINTEAAPDSIRYVPARGENQEEIDLEILRSRIDRLSCKMVQVAAQGKNSADSPLNTPFILFIFPAIPIIVYIVWVLYVYIGPIVAAFLYFLFSKSGITLTIASTAVLTVLLIYQWNALRTVSVLESITIPVDISLLQAKIRYIKWRKELVSKLKRFSQTHVLSHLRVIDELVERRFGIRIIVPYLAWRAGYKKLSYDPLAMFAPTEEKFEDDIDATTDSDTDEESNFSDMDLGSETEQNKRIRKEDVSVEKFFAFKFQLHYIREIREKYRAVWIEILDDSSDVVLCCSPLNTRFHSVGIGTNDVSVHDIQHSDSFSGENEGGMEFEVRLGYHPTRMVQDLFDKFDDHGLRIVVKGITEDVVLDGEDFIPTWLQMTDKGQVVGALRLSAKLLVRGLFDKDSQLFSSGLQDAQQKGVHKTTVFLPVLSLKYAGYSCGLIKATVAVQRLLDASYSYLDFVEAFPSGDWSLKISLLELRDLIAVDASNTSDPYVLVEAFGQTKRSKTYIRALTCALEETVFFSGPFRGDSIIHEKLVIRVMDWNRFGSGDVLIGEVPIQLLRIYKAQQKNVKSTWFQLTLPGRPNEVRGYIKFGAELRPPKSSADVARASPFLNDSEGPSGLGLLNASVLRGCPLRVTEKVLILRLGELDMLPPMLDYTSGSRDLVRCYATIEFLGINQLLKTHTIIGEAFQVQDPFVGVEKLVEIRKNRQVHLNTDIYLPVRLNNGILLHESLKISVYHRRPRMNPANQHVLIGEVVFSFSDLFASEIQAAIRSEQTEAVDTSSEGGQSGTGGELSGSLASQSGEFKHETRFCRVGIAPPRWLNLYWKPNDITELGVGNEYRGRILLGALSRHAKISNPVMRPSTRQLARPAVSLFEIVFEVSRATELYLKDSTSLCIRCSIGLYTFGHTIPIKQVKDGCCQWDVGSQLQLRGLQFPAALEQIPDLYVYLYVRNTDAVQQNIEIPLTTRRSSTYFGVVNEAPSLASLASEVLRAQDSNLGDDWTCISYIRIPARHMLLAQQTPRWIFMDRYGFASSCINTNPGSLLLYARLKACDSNYFDARLEWIERNRFHSIAMKHLYEGLRSGSIVRVRSEVHFGAGQYPTEATISSNEVVNMESPRTVSYYSASSSPRIEGFEDSLFPGSQNSKDECDRGSHASSSESDVVSMPSEIIPIVPSQIHENHSPRGSNSPIEPATLLDAALSGGSFLLSPRQLLSVTSSPTLTGDDQYELRALVLEGRDLPAANPSGLSDPFAVVSMGNRAARGSIVCKQTLNPVWDEIVALSQVSVREGERKPNVNVLVYDWDEEGRDTFLGRAIIPGYELIDSDLSVTKAQWYPLFSYNPTIPIGHILLDLQLVKVRKASDRSKRSAKFAIDDKMNSFVKPTVTFRQTTALQVCIFGIFGLKCLRVAEGDIFLECQVSGDRSSVARTKRSTMIPISKYQACSSIMDVFLLTISIPEGSALAPSLDMTIYAEYRHHRHMEQVAALSLSLSSYISELDKNVLELDEIVANTFGQDSPLPESMKRKFRFRREDEKFSMVQELIDLGMQGDLASLRDRVFAVSSGTRNESFRKFTLQSALTETKATFRHQLEFINKPSATNVVSEDVPLLRDSLIGQDPYISMSVRSNRNHPVSTSEIDEALDWGSWRWITSLYTIILFYIRCFRRAAYFAIATCLNSVTDTIPDVANRLGLPYIYIAEEARISNSKGVQGPLKDPSNGAKDKNNKSGVPWYIPSIRRSQKALNAGDDSTADRLASIELMRSSGSSASSFGDIPDSLHDTYAYDTTLALRKERGFCPDGIEKEFPNPVFNKIPLYRGDSRTLGHLFSPISGIEEQVMAGLEGNRGAVRSEVQQAIQEGKRPMVGSLKLRFDLVNLSDSKSLAYQKSRLACMRAFNKRFAPLDVLARVYVLRGVELESSGFVCNPYVSMDSLIGIPKHVTSRHTPMLKTNNPNFFLCFETRVQMPGGILRLCVKDRSLPKVLVPVAYPWYVESGSGTKVLSVVTGEKKINFGSLGIAWSELIGEALIDLDARWYNPYWHRLEYTPVESLSLQKEGNVHTRGRLEVIVDMFDADKVDRRPILYRPLKFTRPGSIRIQLRLVIFKLEEAWLPYQLSEDTSYLANFNISCRLGNLYNEIRNTDVCYYCQSGSAEYNWRMSWWLQLPSVTCPPRIKIQVFDNQAMAFSQSRLCGTADVLISGMIEEVLSSQKGIIQRKQKVTLGHPMSPSISPKVTLALELLTEEETKQKKCCFGFQSYDKTQDPDYVLPRPFRPVPFSVFNPVPYFSYQVSYAMMNLQWALAVYLLPFPLIPMFVKLVALLPWKWYGLSGLFGLIIMLRVVLIEMARFSKQREDAVRYENEQDDQKEYEAVLQSGNVGELNKVVKDAVPMQ